MSKVGDAIKGVGLGVGVIVGAGVGVFVGMGVGVFVGVGIGVFVGVGVDDGIFVGVGVTMATGIGVGSCMGIGADTGTASRGGGGKLRPPLIAKSSTTPSMAAAGQLPSFAIRTRSLARRPNRE